MEIEILKFDLFIFDLDDTLIKTEKYHYISWLNTIQKYKNDYTFEFSYDTFSKNFHSISPNSIQNYLTEIGIVNIDNIIIEKNKYYLNLISNEKNIEMVEGIEKFIEFILKNNKKFVIVTNTFEKNLNFFINMFPILKKSEKNYFREMFKNKKPNPECYNMVIKDFPKEKKIAFEDSITGIHALSQTKDIKIVLVNDFNYIYYDYIIKNYDILLFDNIKNI